MAVRRLARSLFTLCSAVSLLLCLAVVAVRVRPDLLGRQPLGVGERRLYVSDGLAVLMVDRTWPDIEDLLDARRGENFKHTWLGFGAGGGRFRRWHDEGAIWSSAYVRWWQVPLWCPAALLALPPLALAARRVAAVRRRRSRSRAGLCPACGYDLRATPGRCPECGHSGGGVQ